MTEETEEFYKYLRGITDYGRVKKMLKKYIQHGSTSVLKHSRDVAYTSYVMAKKMQKKFNVKFDYKVLVSGAFLHDMFLYDWHERNQGHNLHGFTHPKVACKNAKRICNISLKEEHIILSHMWPLTIAHMPISNEAILVCMVDKYVATIEVLMSIKQAMYRELAKFAL